MKINDLAIRRKGSYVFLKDSETCVWFRPCTDAPNEVAEEIMEEFPELAAEEIAEFLAAQFDDCSAEEILKHLHMCAVCKRMTEVYWG